MPRLKAVFAGVGGFFLCSETTTSISVFDIFDLANDKQDKRHCCDIQPLIMLFIINVCFICNCSGSIACYSAQSKTVLANVIFCDGMSWKGGSLLLEGK